MPKKFWDQSYASDTFVYGEVANEFVQKTSSMIPESAKIACYAEGEGRNAVYLATLGHDVTAFDLSTVGLDKTKQLAKKHHVHVKTVAKDLTKDDVPRDQFDVATLIYGHLPKSKQPILIEKVIDSVKQGGLVIIEVYSDDQINYKTGGPSSLEMLYDPKQMLQWIKPYKCLHFYYGEAKRYEGVRHTGLGHIIQVILQKE